MLRSHPPRLLPLVAACCVLVVALNGAAAEGERPAWVPEEHVVGPLPLERLPERLPEWHAVAERHTPEPDVVEWLREARPAHVEILFATWCPDSFDHVPPLLSALAAADNPDLSVELIGLDRDKMEPGGRGLLREIERVPTVVVLREGREVGRVVETPETSMDRDVARILR